MKLSDKNVVGFQEKRGDDFYKITHDEYHDKRAKICGQGFDACDNTMHWIDHTTGVHYVEYMSDGVKVIETYASYVSTGTDVMPGCTALTEPVVTDPTPVLTWPAASGANGYKISIGTTTGGTEHTNALDVGNILSVTPGVTPGIAVLQGLGTEYSVTIIPYSLVGDKTGCPSVEFTNGVPN